MARGRSQAPAPATPVGDDEAAAVAPETREHVLVASLRRDGRRYGIGEPVELTEAEAEELRALQVIA